MKTRHGFLSALAAFVVSAAAFGEAVWETGAYTPSDWSPDPLNLLADATLCENSLTLTSTTFSNYPRSEVSDLFNGQVRDERGSSQPFFIKSGSVTWELSAACIIDSIGVYTCWDGYRDGIAIDSISVSADGENWTELGSSIKYGWENGTSSALFARLVDSEGRPLAEGIRFVRIDFNGSQENGATGYAEIEVSGRNPNDIHFELSSVETEPGRARFEGRITSVFAGQTVDLYAALGCDPMNLPEPTLVRANLAEGETFAFTLDELDTEAVYYYAVHAAHGDVVSELACGMITARDIRRRLPAGLVQVEYIEATGEHYLDTGVDSGVTTGAVLDFVPIEKTGQTLLGNTGWRFSPYEGGQVFFDVASGVRLWSGNDAHLYNNRRKVVVGNHYILMHDDGGRLLWEMTNNTREQVATGRICLFANSTNGQKVRARVYGLVITANGDEIVRDFVPCYRAEDEVCGLYDKVEKTFHPMIGDTDRATNAGPEVKANSGLIMIVR